jgi:ATP-dependent exoDNAse (exonuclease V) beta subunit
MIDQLWYPSLAFRQQGLESTAKDQLYGLAFHRVMALCPDPQSLDTAIQMAIDEGSVGADQQAEIQQGALRFWSHIEQNKLFDGVQEQFNEQRIIADFNELKQPDKVWLKTNEVVVIDFKTGKRQDKDLEQIGAYAKLLNEIFDLPVRAVLYYAQLDLFLDL